MTLAIDLYACPACKHEALEIADDRSALVCPVCDRHYPASAGCVDFRYADEKYKLGDLRIDDEYEPGADEEAQLERKFGSTHNMTNMLMRRMAALREQRGRLNVLDIGMYMHGGGKFKPFIQDIVPLIDRYVGIEASAYEFAETANQDSRVHALRGFGEYLPLRSNQFDVVLSVATFDHMFGPDLCLDECRRVLAPGGALIITLSNDGAWFKRLFVQTAARRREAARRYHNFFWSYGQFRDLLRAHGFQVAEHREYRYNPVIDYLEARHTIPNAIQSPVSGAFDMLGNVLAPGLGGKFSVICRAAE